MEYDKLLNKITVFETKKYPVLINIFKSGSDVD